MTGSASPGPAVADAGVSVVVCCHNSAARLSETLARLAMQRTSARWELVVVDNASTDDTAGAARTLWIRHGSPVELRVVSESRPGLSFAREAGIRDARYDVIVFVDDDNWLEPDYVELAHHIMSEHPAIGALGGEIRAAFNVPPPPWFTAAQSYFAVGPQAPHEGDITCVKLHVAGAGMVLRKSAYERLRALGFEFLLADRQGRELSSGGDTELCLALALIGYRVWYDSRLQLTHLITSPRLTREYLLRLVRGVDAASPVLACYEDVIHGAGRTVLGVYVSMISRRLSWALRATAKTILRRAPVTFCEIEWLSFWHELAALPSLFRAFRHRDRLARIAGTSRLASAGAC